MSGTESLPTPEVDSPAPGTSKTTGETTRKRTRDSKSHSGITPDAKKQQGAGPESQSNLTKNQRKKAKNKARKAAQRQLQNQNFVNKYEVTPEVHPATPRDPATTAGRPGKGKGKSQVPAPKTVAELTAQGLELGDLSEEQIAQIEASSSLGPQGQGKRAKRSTIPLFIHSGRDLRLPMEAVELGRLVLAIQRKAVYDKKAGAEPVCNMASFGHREGRGLISCEDAETVDYIKHALTVIDLEGKTFRAWDRGTSGTTLVTVFLHDKGIMPLGEIQEAMLVMNELEGLEPLHAFKVTPAPNKPSSRTIRFGATGTLLERLKAMEGKINVGGLICKMVIQKPQDQAGQTGSGDLVPTAAPSTDATTVGSAPKKATTSQAQVAAPVCQIRTTEGAPKKATPSHATDTESESNMDVDPTIVQQPLTEEEEQNLLQEDA